MKKLIAISFIGLMLVACNNKQQVEQIKTLQNNDSSLVKQLQHKDSSIMAYIKSINTIQSNVDTLMKEAKLLKRHGEPIVSDTISIVDALRAIGQKMVKNQRDLLTLQIKLKKSNESNDELVDLGENLSKLLNEKDSEISAMQTELAKTRASLNVVVKQFNDSMNTIAQQRAQINLMTTAGNTVLYIVGTAKELKDKGIITNQGGVVGIGHIPTLNENMSSTAGFTSADLTTLHEVILGGSFVRMVTPHPDRSYKIAHTVPDKLIITDPGDFWSKSKYMIVIVK